MLTINLKETGRSMRSANSETDLLTLADEVRIANEDLNAAGLALAALDKTARELEEAAEFSKAVAQKDRSLGSVVAQEMAAIALSNINQDHLAGELVPANEDITVAEEGIKDTMKNVWDKIKEYAKKAWEFIRNLIMKVVDFVKGIFGKEGATYQELADLVKKLKKEKKTDLSVDEFPEATAKRLVSKVTVVMLEKGNKKLTGNEYVEFVNEQYDTVKDLLTKDNIIPTVVQESLVVAHEDDGKIKKDGDDGKIKEDGKTEGSYNILNKTTPRESAIALLVELTGLDSISNVEKKVERIKENDYKNIFDAVDGEISAIADKYAACYQKVISLTPTKVAIATIGIKDDGFDHIDKTDMTYEDLNKFVSNVHYELTIVSPKTDDLIDDYENIKPLTFGELETFVNNLEDKAKKANKNADKYKKMVDKAAKDMEKSIDKTLKSEKYKSNSDVANVIRKIFSLLTSKAKEEARGFAETYMSLARSTIGDVYKESARLYKKV